MDRTTPRDVTFAPIGEAGLLVFFPNRIRPEVNARVHALRRDLLIAALPGVVDLVPAYASLLVIFDPDRNDHANLCQEIPRVLAAPGERKDGLVEHGATHVVPVRYGGEDGPDLFETASLNNVTSEELIRLHAGRTYLAYFLGFLPGFAYLGMLPEGVVAPRLATPRMRVPAGSVGMAGAQTAVYPLQSPGGWRIIGRTSLTMWDPYANEPATIAPGDAVKFVPGEVEQVVGRAEQASHATANPVFEVLTAEGMTTVQDLGRPGFAHLGVARGGAFDRVAAVRANALLGNALEAAVLEMTWTGPKLRALRSATIVVDGADLECRVDGVVVSPRMSWFVRRGSIVSFGRGQPGRGVRGYLAVAGGIDAPVALGSRSTSLQGNFGGWEGRPLQAGDILGIAEPNDAGGMIAGRYWSGSVPRLPGGEVEVRFIAYRGRGEAPASARRALGAEAFRLSDKADRMGYRFAAEDGMTLPTRAGELVSFGVVRGAIQLPPDGNPVLLNVDHQTTGGYPLLGVVVMADWPLLAQLSPGTTVRFRGTSFEEAAKARVSSDRELARGLRAVSRT
jgi:KipI family sensor histidine kinase inhibitor